MRVQHFFPTNEPKQGDVACCGHIAPEGIKPYNLGDCGYWCGKCIETVRNDLKVQVPTKIAG